MEGVHLREKAKAPKIFVKDDMPSTNDTILFTTDELGETVLIKEVDYLDSEFVVQTQPAQLASTSGLKPGNSAANSLLQLSQAKTNEEEEETVLVHPESVIEIPGQEGSYVLVTTGNDDEQKLMAISQLSTYISHQPPDPPAQ